MNRAAAINEIRNFKESWDIIVIGGGASGMGTAVDAASRGFKTLLLEQDDFGKGTSSRSTKLVHGGVRYLKQGDVSMVFEALKERGLLFRNAPHLVRNQSFIIPAYDWWESPFYTVGLKVYDFMSGKLGLGPSRHISAEEVIQALPTVDRKGLKGGIIYHDGQFDDTRMIISLARTCEHYGGSLLNYMKVTGIIKDMNMITGVEARDMETGEEFSIRSKVVINATGVFADEIMKMDRPGVSSMITPSQGIHLVLDQEFLESEHAIMVPQTTDGRVLFAVPWYNKVVVGTTDTLVDKISLEPKALDQEIDFILDTAGQYLVKKPSRHDVLSCFAGLRPLAAPECEGKATREISRHHKTLVSVSGLITILGGKWTTYRKMAEDAVDYAIMIGKFPERNCNTRNLPIHGYNMNTVAGSDSMSAYGLEASELEKISNENHTLRGYLSESLAINRVQVIWAVRLEMARRLEDVLARRTRALFLDARESLRMAPETAGLMAGEMGHGKEWISKQLFEYEKLTAGYIIN